MVAGEGISITQTSASYAAKDAGSGITVSASLGAADYAATSGTLLANYVLPTTASGAIGTITPLTLTYVATPTQRYVGQPNPVFSGAVQGFLGSETVATATSGTLAFASPATTLSDSGTYAINGGGLSAANYVFTQSPANAAALLVIQNVSSMVSSVVQLVTLIAPTPVATPALVASTPAPASPAPTNAVPASSSSSSSGATSTASDTPASQPAAPAPASNDSSSSPPASASPASGSPSTKPAPAAEPAAVSGGGAPPPPPPGAPPAPAPTPAPASGGGATGGSRPAPAVVAVVAVAAPPVDPTPPSPVPVKPQPTPSDSEDKGDAVLQMALSSSPGLRASAQIGKSVQLIPGLTMAAMPVAPPRTAAPQQIPSMDFAGGLFR